MGLEFLPTGEIKSDLPPGMGWRWRLLRWGIAILVFVFIAWLTGR